MYDFSQSVFILDLTASIWCNKASGHFFLSPSTNWIVWIIICFKTQKPLKRLRKLSNHQLLRKKIKEYNNACMINFPWHRHEDEVDTAKFGVSAWPSFCRLCTTGYRPEWQREILFYKEEEAWPLLGRGNSRNSGTLSGLKGWLRVN